jgi:hypothetical protein
MVPSPGSDSVNRSLTGHCRFSFLCERSFEMEHINPLPGELIFVEQSEWYALKHGQQLRVCEHPGWTIAGRDIYVVPRHQARTFWGPDFGPPDGIKRERMSTSGGPFKTIRLSMIADLKWLSVTDDEFWHWEDWPRAGGGVEYRRQVNRWQLPLLPDRTSQDEGECR